MACIYLWPNPLQTENCVHGLFISIPSNQKGYSIYLPHTRYIAVSGDVSFDEPFHSAIATTWHWFQDSLLLHHSDSFLPDPETLLEQTGTLENFVSPTASDDITHSTLQEGASETYYLPTSSDGISSPLIIENTFSSPQCTHQAPWRVSFDIHQPAQDWYECANICSDLELVVACTAYATTARNSSSSDASIFEPAPASTCQVFKIPFMMHGTRHMAKSSSLSSNPTLSPLTLYYQMRSVFQILTSTKSKSTLMVLYTNLKPAL